MPAEQALVLARHPGRVSAAANRLVLDWSRETLGSSTTARVVAEAERRHGVRVEAEGAWAPFATHLALLDALASEVGVDRLAEAGRYNARHVERVVPGVGFLLKFVKPRRLLSEAPMLWKTYADFGRIERAEGRDGAGEIAFTGFAPTPAFCASLQGFFGGLLTRVGANAVRLEHPECLAKGAPRCRFVGAWA
ncbi:MAG TPA: hypothetical protein VM889_01780 [Candidatus Thermoplasmatota archaeon]|nr:hypothetical protein [Candidatus Thermoplasmatota archaeon]